MTEEAFTPAEGLIQFPSLPRTFKKVKAVTIRLSDRKGVMREHRVTVYMQAAGTPTFAVGAPTEYAVAWDKHRCSESEHHRFYVRDGVLQAESFDEVLKRLESMSFNWQHHIQSIAIRKIIWIDTNLVAPGAQINHQAPSFNSARVLVGIRSGIYWEVNGAFYEPDLGFRFRDEPEEDVGEMTYDKLRPSGRSLRSNGTVIPFTQEAWDAICAIEATLERAAVMLHGLTDATKAQALLEGGMQGLLSAPKADAS